MGYTEVLYAKISMLKMEELVTTGKKLWTLVKMWTINYFNGDIWQELAAQETPNGVTFCDANYYRQFKLDLHQRRTLRVYDRGLVSISYLFLFDGLCRFWFWFLVSFQDQHDGGRYVSLL